MKLSKTRISIIVLFIIVYGIFMIWLNSHSEYTTYYPDYVVEDENNNLIYLVPDCPVGTAPYLILDCPKKIEKVPPAYYIYQVIDEYRGLIIFLLLLYLSLYTFKYRKQVKNDYKKLKEFFEKLEVNDDKK